MSGAGRKAGGKSPSSDDPNANLSRPLSAALSDLRPVILMCYAALAGPLSQVGQYRELRADGSKVLISLPANSPWQCART